MAMTGYMYIQLLGAEMAGLPRTAAVAAAEREN